MHAPEGEKRLGHPFAGIARKGAGHASAAAASERRRRRVAGAIEHVAGGERGRRLAHDTVAGLDRREDGSGRGGTAAARGFDARGHGCWIEVFGIEVSMVAAVGVSMELR